MLSYAVDMPSLLALMFDELFLSSLVLVPGCNFRPSTQDIQEWEFAGLRYVVYRCMLSYAVDMPSLLALMFDELFLSSLVFSSGLQFPDHGLKTSRSWEPRWPSLCCCIDVMSSYAVRLCLASYTLKFVEL
jgi:hypothetical protein